MTAGERSDITNAIWLCEWHGRLVDEDERTFSASELNDMKMAHENRVRAEIMGGSNSLSKTDFIAIGPNVIFVGEMMGIEPGSWTFRMDHFLLGDLATFIEFGERFDRTDPYDRFVLVNSLGDGRQLACAPTWRKTDSGDLVTLKIIDSFPRINAHDLAADLVLSDVHDLVLVDGEIPIVAGLDALPQKVQVCLSTLKGDMPFNPVFGVRISEFCDLFRGSPWLQRLIKLEVIRMACVPYIESVTREVYTPLQCVLRVRGVEQLPSTNRTDWTPFRLHLDVAGVGAWTCEVPLFVPQGRH